MYVFFESLTHPIFSKQETKAQTLKSVSNIRLLIEDKCKKLYRFILLKRFLPQGYNTKPSTYLKKTLEEKEKTSFQLQPIFPPNKNEIIIVRHK
jgi:hypothetical protein